MNARQYAQQDGASQSFTRSMHLCHSSPGPSKTTGQSLSQAQLPFLVRPDRPRQQPPRRQPANARLRRAVDVFLLGLYA